jgi:hypothetical protein
MNTGASVSDQQISEFFTVVPVTQLDRDFYHHVTIIMIRGIIVES